MGRSPATTRGRATRSSGPRPRRRRPTTSTTCPRSGPSARCSTPGTAGPRPTERERAMTSDAAVITPHGETDAVPHGVAGLGNPVLGMLLFITSEVMFFAGLFAAYFSIRAGYQELNKTTGQLQHVWPPTAFTHLLNPFTLFTETGALNLILPATVILVISSVTCQMGVWAIRRDDRTGFLRNFAVTLVLGITFLLMQAYDYTVLAKEGLSLGATTFGTTYFTLTGFHGA